MPHDLVADPGKRNAVDQLLRIAPLPARSVGFGNTGDASCPRSNASNQNALLGYGPTTARHFDADYQVIAWSGAGVNVYPNTRSGRRGQILGVS